MNETQSSKVKIWHYIDNVADDVVMNSSYLNSFDITEEVMEKIDHNIVMQLASEVYNIKTDNFDPRSLVFSVLWRDIWSERALGEVESSNIHALGYSIMREELYVVFNSDKNVVYVYDKESPRTFYDIVNADSHGSMLHKKVLGNRERLGYELHSIDNYELLDELLE